MARCNDIKCRGPVGREDIFDQSFVSVFDEWKIDTVFFFTVNTANHGFIIWSQCSKNLNDYEIYVLQFFLFLTLQFLIRLNDIKKIVYYAQYVISEILIVFYSFWAKYAFLNVLKHWLVIIYVRDWSTKNYIFLKTDCIANVNEKLISHYVPQFTLYII